jgi:hypothetical protein
MEMEAMMRVAAKRGRVRDQRKVICSRAMVGKRTRG